MKELKFTLTVLTTSDVDEAIHSRGFSALEAEGVILQTGWLPKMFKRALRPVSIRRRSWRPTTATRP